MIEEITKIIHLLNKKKKKKKREKCVIQNERWA